MAKIPDTPLNYFLHAAGPAARPTMVLGWVFTGITLAVCIIIAVLLLGAIFHRRPAAGPRALGREEGGMRWLAIGTGISVCVLFGMALYAFVTLNISATPPAEAALTIHVTGYDWWWKADYGGGLVTANEIHIPVHQPVLITLDSADVIHAFWVPRLAGKTEMIPGQTNRQWLEADAPGVYRGQCTQFCGLQHAHMAFEVVAQSADDFAAWERAERQPAAHPAAPVFMQNCAACHAVRGTDAAGTHGPDLTHLAARRMLAAGTLANTPEHVLEWVRHAQEIKPGCRMPDFALTAEQASALSAYLATLK